MLVTQGIYTAGAGDVVVNTPLAVNQHVPHSRNKVIAFNTLNGCLNGGVLYRSRRGGGVSSSRCAIVNNVITNANIFQSRSPPLPAAML
jgi:hypothetical protein